MKHALIKGLIVGLLWGVTIVLIPQMFQLGSSLAELFHQPEIWLNIR